MNQKAGNSDKKTVKGETEPFCQAMACEKDIGLCP